MSTLTNSSRLPVTTPDAAKGQVLVDGALLLPRTVVATHALLTGEGVDAYRRTFPAPAPGRTSSPTRVATHVVLGLVLGLVTLAVLSALIATLVVSPLLLAPAGGVTLLALAGLGAVHDALTRHLMDR